METDRLLGYPMLRPPHFWMLRFPSMRLLPFTGVCLKQSDTQEGLSLGVPRNGHFGAYGKKGLTPLAMLVLCDYSACRRKTRTNTSGLFGA